MVAARKRLDPPGVKRCGKCGLVKHVEDFAADRGKPSGRKSLCLVCDRVKFRRYYAANRDQYSAARGAPGHCGGGTGEAAAPARGAGPQTRSAEVP